MSARGIRAGRAYVEIGADDSRLMKGLRSVQAKLKSFGQNVAMAGAGITAAGGAVLGAVTGAAAHFASSGDELSKMSNKTGASVESLSELRHAASQSAVDFAALGKGINKQQRNLAEAANGNKTAQEAFDRLGLSVEGLLGLSPDQQFEAIADRIAAIEDPAKRTAAAMDVFGKSGADMLPLMMEGSRGIQALRQEARDLGLQVSTEDATAATLFGDTWANVMSVVKDALFEIGAAVAPVITDILQKIMPLITAGTNWISQNRQLVVIISAVAAGVAAFGTVVFGLGTAFVFVGSAVGVFATVLSGALAVLGAILSPLGLIIAALTAGVGAWLYFSGAGGEAVNYLSGILNDLWAWTSKVFGGIYDAIAAGNWQLAGEILWKALQIAWQTGIGTIMVMWVQFKNGVFEVFDGLITGIRSMWNNITTWIADKIAWIIGGVSSLVESITGFQIVAESTMQDMRQAIQEDNAAFQQQLEEGQTRRANARDAAVQATREQHNTAPLQAELDELIASAASQREAADAGRAAADAQRKQAEAPKFEVDDFELPDFEAPEIVIPEVALPDLTALEAIATPAIEDAQKRDEVAGTFSGALAGQLASSGEVWWKAIAESNAKIEKNTRNSSKLVLT